MLIKLPFIESVYDLWYHNCIAEMDCIVIFMEEDMRELEYPFDSEYILKRAKSIKKVLLADNSPRIQKKIAVLGGSTTHDIVKVL